MPKSMYRLNTHLWRLSQLCAHFTVYAKFKYPKKLLFGGKWSGEKRRGAAGDKWVRPERLFFTPDTCTSSQIPHQGLTLSLSCTIVCWRALQTLLWIPPCATPTGLCPALPERQTKHWIPKHRPLGIPLPEGDKYRNSGLIHSSTLHPSSVPQETKRWGGGGEEESCMG